MIGSHDHLTWRAGSIGQRKDPKVFGLRSNEQEKGHPYTQENVLE